MSGSRRGSDGGSEDRPGTRRSGAEAGAVFLTGTTGFIGGEALKRILEREPGRPVFALVRAADDATAQRRGREAIFKLFTDDREATDDAKARVRWVRGDISNPQLFASPADRVAVVAECTELIHAAASTDFDLPLAEAEAVNFVGAKAIADLAVEIAKTSSGRLSRLIHVSTAYVAGARLGRIAADELPGPSGPFNNTYEQTKAAAERYLRERMGEAPITITRPSIVVGDSATGRTYNFNVLYFPIKLMHRGLLPYVPGGSRTTLDIVPVDYVCDALLTLGRDAAGIGKTYHLTADDDAIPLQRFGDKIIDFYNRQRAQVSQPPLPYTKAVGKLRWWLISWLTRRRLAGRALELFEMFNVYLPYITTEKVFEAKATREALGSRVPYPKIESYLERVADYAVTREWGKRVSWDPSAYDPEASLAEEAQPARKPNAP